MFPCPVAWFLEKTRLIIEDDISCDSSTNIDVIFRFHPEVSVIQGHENKLILNLPSGQKALFGYDASLIAVIEETTWHPRFGVAIESELIRFSKSIMGTTNLKFYLIWEQ